MKREGGGLQVDAPFQAAAWAIASAVAFTLGAAAAKHLSVHLPPAELAFIRAAVAALALAGLWRWALRLGELRDLRWHVVRLVLGVVAGYCVMHALSLAPIALVSLVYFSRVLLIPVVAQIMLGERAGAAEWAGALLGAVGVVVTTGGLPSADSLLGVTLAAVAAVASAGSQTAVRRLTASNDPALIVLVFAAGSTLALAPAAGALWVPPALMDWPVLLLVGVFAVVAQYTAAQAFARAPAAVVGPFDFLTVPASAVVGIAVFGEWPGASMAYGGALIVAGAAVVTWGDTVRRRQGVA